MKYKLLRCPFCDAIPAMMAHRASAPNMKMVACENDQCQASPTVIGSNGAQAAMRWNIRFHDPDGFHEVTPRGRFS